MPPLRPRSSACGSVPVATNDMSLANTITPRCSTGSSGSSAAGRSQTRRRPFCAASSKLASHSRIRTGEVTPQKPKPRSPMLRRSMRA